MPKILLVAEKPAAARDFAAALTGGTFGGQGPHRGRMADGTELTVVSARGHLFELAKPETYDPKFGAWNVHDLPIVPTKRWDFIEEPRADGGSLLEVLRQEAAAHAGCEIVNGCDAEREGEVIFRKALRGVKASSLFDGRAEPVRTVLPESVPSENIQRLWREATCLADSPAERYLAGRGISAGSPDLR